MSWLSAAELSDMRTDVANMLFDTAVIQSKTTAKDGAGGGSVTYAAVTGGTVSCRIDPLSSGSRTEVMAKLGREITRIVYQLTVPYDAPLAVDRRVVINNNTYEIVQLDIDHSKNVSRRAIVAEIR